VSADQGSEITPRARKPPRLGFWSGARAVFDGFSWLVKTPAIWPAALVPTLVWTVLAAGAVYASVYHLEPWLSARLPEIAYGVTRVAAWLLTALAGLFGAWLAFLLTPPLSGPALERVVAAVELEIGAPPRAPLSFVTETWCSVRSLVAGFLLVLPLLVVCLLLDLLVPLLAPLSTALKVFATALGLSWSLLDYPLTLRNLRMRTRFALFKRRFEPVLGFGAALAPLFWLPCCQLLSLPAGVAAATFLYQRLLEADASVERDPELPA
jgi:uncharacterized protein involved in cysteine biosynthesis